MILNKLVLANYAMAFL